MADSQTAVPPVSIKINSHLALEVLCLVGEKMDVPAPLHELTHRHARYIDRCMFWAGTATLVAYAVLHTLMWTLSGELRELSSMERTAALTACIAQIVVTVSDVITQRWRENNAPGRQAAAKAFYSGSGGLWAARMVLARPSILFSDRTLLYSCLPLDSNARPFPRSPPTCRWRTCSPSRSRSTR